ncbi:MAG TPA: C-terminal binding protein [Candidatus Hydrogenedentes bacterium]|nr:C-terminal binding protein [Candidatus Hydrogenedentota bacterium]HPG67767.1 C-terminal binding protein [Candidatus Hydrogenedentota bacterium]
MTQPEDKRVVVVDTGYASYDQEREILGRSGYSLELFGGDRLDTAGKAAFAYGATGMLVRWTTVDGAFLDTASTLKAIVRYGVGHDNIDLAAAAARGIAVCNVQGYANHSVSDHALALVLACVRNLRSGMAQLRPNYTAAPNAYMPELREMTLGIIGLGRIGGTLCTKARGLFKRVMACDPYVPAGRFSKLGAEACSLDELLAASDVVSLHCNLTNETHHLLDAAAFGRMRPNVVVINTARGPVMDEDALTAALEAGKVFAAGLDVFEDEPPLSNRDPLLLHPRVVATGHYAWYSERASFELQRRAALNLEAMLRGELPEDCLNRDGLRGTMRWKSVSTGHGLHGE